DQELEQIPLHFRDAHVEAPVTVHGGEPGGTFPLEQLGDRGARLPDRMPYEDAQRPSMGAKLLDVKELESVISEEPYQRVEREIRVVLVVDRVELQSVHELHEMGNLHGDDTIRRQEDPHTFDEVVEIGHLREDVVRG